jgi:cathepsin B
MTDRVCIASKGAQKPHISAQDLLTCCGFSCG